MKAPLLRTDTRVVAGVCSGLAVHLGWPVTLVRILMVLLALAGGPGLVLYAWLWVLVPTAAEAADSAKADRNPRSVAGNFADYLRDSRSAESAPDQGQDRPRWIAAAANREVLAGIALLGVAGVVIAQVLGVPVNWPALLPAGTIVVGAVLAWTQLDETRRAGLLSRAGADRRSGALRLGPDCCWW